MSSLDAADGVGEGAVDESVKISILVVPGQPITDLLEGSAVKIGAGLLRCEDDVVATVPGLLCCRNPRKYWVEGNGKRYMPAVNDTVIGVVVDKSSESYRLNIGSSCLANLGALSFDGATKRNKPSLAVGALVFARVEACDPDLEPEVTCKAGAGVGVGDGSKAKDWVTGQGMFGELKQGTVVQASLLNCRRMLSPSGSVLGLLAGAGIPFEVAVGVNGCVWVNSGSLKHTCAVVNAITAAEITPEDKLPGTIRKLLSL